MKIRATHFPQRPRSHHCRICNSCILRMDHHCVWINNCVAHVCFCVNFKVIIDWRKANSWPFHAVSTLRAGLGIYHFGLFSKTSIWNPDASTYTVVWHSSEGPYDLVHWLAYSWFNINVDDRTTEHIWIQKYAGEQNDYRKHAIAEFGKGSKTA